MSVANGIVDIAAYVPDARVSNRTLMQRFDIDESFLEGKIGVINRAVKGPEETTTSMALAALEKLIGQRGLDRSSIDALVVVTQNPDTTMPHTAALVHGLAGLAESCATFDISLGCSGYVCGLSVLQSFLASNGLGHGVLLTCDPYSKIVDPDDKNTALLFGDAATATLIGPDPAFACGPFSFGTRGQAASALEFRDGRLHMNGREVFNFAAKVVPADMDRLLARAGVAREDVDCFIFHQGSRFIVESLARYARLPTNKIRLGLEQVGNTVSSSIPLLLAEELANPASRTIFMSGFGVGLAWASCLCRRPGAFA